MIICLVDVAFLIQFNVPKQCLFLKFASIYFVTICNINIPVFFKKKYQHIFTKVNFFVGM